jgi:hypothetical protein
MLYLPQENASPSSRYSSRYGQPVPAKEQNGHAAHEDTNGHSSSSSSTAGGKSNGAYSTHSAPLTRAAAARLQAACV